MDKKSKYVAFRGYSLHELRLRMVVNEAKQHQVRDAVAELVRDIRSTGHETDLTESERVWKHGWLGKLDALVAVGNYVVTGYGLYRNLKSLF